jgi:hypothetical protein
MRHLRKSACRTASILRFRKSDELLWGSCVEGGMAATLLVMIADCVRSGDASKLRGNLADVLK